MIKNMAVISEYGLLKWNNSNRKRYVDLGYSFTKNGDEFNVKIEHLTETSRALVTVACDYCGTTRELIFKEYNNKLKKSIVQKTTCSSKECRNAKNTESNILKYGVEHQSKSKQVIENKKNSVRAKYGKEYSITLQVPHIKEKADRSREIKYGNSNVFATEYGKNKIKETNLIKYGKEYYTQTEDYNIKVTETSLLMYGVNHFTQAESVKEKQRQTNLIKYGYLYTLQSPEVRQKIESTNIHRYGFRYFTQTEEYRISNSGENHHNWNFNKTEEERLQERNYPEYYQWRKSVYERDKYTCQCCGIEGSKSKLNAHHKNGYHWCIEGRTKLENGVTLCESCHIEFHVTYGKGFNTESQYNEFINNKYILHN